MATVRVIEKNSKSLIVIKTAEGIPVPFALCACFDFFISRLLKGRKLEDINVDSLSQTDLDSKWLGTLFKICNVSDGISLYILSYPE